MTITHPTIVDEVDTSTVDIAEVPKKFARLEDELNEEIVERSAPIRTAMVALVAGAHHFQYGEPGIAKSLLVRRIVKRIWGLGPGDYYEYLFGKTMTPEEALGGPNLLHLRDTGGYRRITRNMLPEAKFAFIDEIWKANNALANSLLSIANERIFHNGDAGAIQVPLRTIFCASNEVPENENELAAIWDRIQFRHLVERISEPGMFLRMLKTEHPDEVEPVISWAEIVAAIEAARQVEVPSDVYEALNELRMTLKSDNIEPSDRRFKGCLPIIRATAFLDGRDVAETDDLRTLSHVLWTKVEFAPIVERHCLELANPLDRKALELIELCGQYTAKLHEAIEDHDPNSPQSKQQLNEIGLDIYSKIDRLKKDYRGLRKEVEAKGGGRRSEYLAEAKQRILALAELLRERVFSLDRKTIDEEMD